MPVGRVDDFDASPFEFSLKDGSSHLQASMEDRINVKVKIKTMNSAGGEGVHEFVIRNTEGLTLPQLFKDKTIQQIARDAGQSVGKADKLLKQVQAQATSTTSKPLPIEDKRQTFFQKLFQKKPASQEDISRASLVEARFREISPQANDKIDSGSSSKPSLITDLKKLQKDGEALMEKMKKRESNLNSLSLKLREINAKMQGIIDKL